MAAYGGMDRAGGAALGWPAAAGRLAMVGAVTTTKVKGRSTKVNEATRMAYLLFHCPVLVVGRAVVKRGDYPRSPKGCIDFAAKEMGVTVAQINNHLHNCSVALSKRLDEPKPEGAEAVCIDVLRRGGSLEVAARRARIARHTVAEAWIAADNGEDNEFGHKMLEAWAQYELDIIGDPQLEESRRRAHERGDWRPAGEPEDRIENWNYYRENVTVIDNQMRFDDLLKEAENGERQTEEAQAQRAG